MCDKKNSVLFTDTACIVLSPDFKLTNENHVLLKVPRKDNMYSVDLKNVVPQGGLTCLFAKATPDESNLWHRRLGHVNFKTMNKLVGKQHRASCIENLIDLRVLRGYLGVAGLHKQKWSCSKENRTIIEVWQDMLADLKLPTTFWAEAVNTACYVQNRVIHHTNSKAFRVFNSRTRIVEENMHVQFSENTPNITGSGPNWLFDIDELTKSYEYKQFVAGIKSIDPPFSSSSKDSPDAGFIPSREEEKKDAEDLGNESGNPTEWKDSEISSTKEPRINQEKDDNINNTNNINTASDGNITNNVNAVSSTVNAAGSEVNAVD
ncbi:ribonuclease H-like domain-containing protein [Tanacetum coccineum]